MTFSERLYGQVEFWLESLTDGQTVEIQVEVEGYDWERVHEVRLEEGFVVAKLSGPADGAVQDLIFDISSLKAARFSPIDG